jgi:glyoxylase I family protein
MLNLCHIHHIAMIATEYHLSKQFYTQVLGFQIMQEVYRADKQSYKLDLSLNGIYCIELFSFPHVKPRASFPEQAGLRHLAFSVDNIELAYQYLQQKNVSLQSIRTDEHTGKQFFFFYDPSGQPLEIYQL